MNAVARWWRHPCMVLGFLALMGASPNASDVQPEREGAAGVPMSTPAEKQRCIDTYVQCKEECWVGPYGDCLHKCITQGEWDIKMCRKPERR